MINKELIKGMAKKLDTLIDFTKIIKNKVIGAMAEMADGYVFNAGLDYLNEKFGSKIPSKFLPEVEQAIACFNESDYAGALRAIPEGFDEAIDVKFLDDDFESIWIATNFNAAFKAAMYYSKLQLNTAE
jgi:hypothetical protein